MIENKNDFTANNPDLRIAISSDHNARVQQMAHLGSWKIDFNTSRVYASDEARRIYGFKKSVLTIKDVQDAAIPEFRPFLDREMANLIAGTGNYDIEYQVKRPIDGQIRYIHSIAEFHKNENSVSGVFQDITEQKLMETALAENEKRYRSLFDNSVSGILYLGLDGYILEANKKMLQLLGSPSLDATKKINTLTFPLLVETGFSADLKKVIDSGDEVSNSVYYSSKWGHKHFLEYYLTPIKDDDRIIGIMGKIEDITERRKAEAKVESLLKEKDIILREVHHRIKNNMASIEGLLKLQIEDSKNEDVKSELKDAVGRLSSMRILYEKLYQSEDFMETSSAAYLTKLIDDIAEVFPESENIKIEKALDDFMIPTEITFSLGIIINELLTNALKYAFNGILENKLILISAKKSGSVVNIVVRDNGSGFSKPGEERRGGFGLQLIRMLSKQIGGDAEFYNDDGAVFSINFKV